MTEIDLHAITRRLEIIKAESSQGGPPSLSTFRNVSDVLADVPGLVDEVRWHRAAMTEIKNAVHARRAQARAALWNTVESMEYEAALSALSGNHDYASRKAALASVSAAYDARRAQVAKEYAVDWF